ncbi:MAG: hypothetical protein ACLQG3_14495 [Terracidiphilus sp.]
MQITKPQLARLQTLYGQLAAREIGLDSGRESRLRWASERLQREVASFSGLSLNEANFLIDSIQQELGVKAAPKKRLKREQARRAGLDGRSDGAEYSAAPQMATSDDLDRIQRLLDQLGWDQDIFRKFLKSARSPLAKRGDKSIRTTSDANKVWWALKRIARKKGIWRKRA